MWELLTKPGTFAATLGRKAASLHSGIAFGSEGRKSLTLPPFVLHGSLGAGDDGGQRPRGVSGWRGHSSLEAVGDLVGQLAALYDLAVQDVAHDAHVPKVGPVRPTAVRCPYRHPAGVG